MSAIIGPTLSNTATAADPLAQAAKVPVVAVSNTAPKGITDIGDYIWRVSLTEGQVIPGALKRLQAKLGFKKAGLLYGNDDAFTQAGYNVMKAAARGACGIQIVGTQTFAKPDRDFNAQLTALKALEPGHPHGLGAGRERRRHRDPGAPARLATCPSWAATASTAQLHQANAGPAAEGVYVGTAWNKVSAEPANQAFLEGHEGARQRPRPVLRPGLHRRAGHRRGHQAGRR